MANPLVFSHNGASTGRYARTRTMTALTAPAVAEKAQVTLGTVTGGFIIQPNEYP